MIAPGTIYFAPPDYHLSVERHGHFSLSNEEEVFFSRPSIDVLFESAADSFGDAVIGVVLTGANPDGAAGLKAIADAGGIAIVQQPKEAYSAAMPKAALAACPHAHILSLTDIAPYLQRIAS